MTRTRATDPAPLLLASAVGLFLLTAVIFLPLSHWLRYGDFQVFYDAARNLVRGQPVYVRGDMPFLNPPFFAALLVPLAALPYTVARWLWSALALLATAVAARGLLGPEPATPRRRAWLWATLLAVPIFIGDLQIGQNTVFVLVGIAGWTVLRRRGQPVLAGAVLGAGLVKPQLLVGPVVALIAARRWRELAGFGAIAAGLAAISGALVGADGIAGYLDVARDVATWVTRGHYFRSDMHTPNALVHEYLSPAVAGPLVGVIAIAAATLLVRRVARRDLSDGETVSLAVVGTFLIAPYAHVSDLMLLAAPWLLLGPTAHGRRAWLLAGTLFAPALTLLSVALGGPGQLTVLAQAALFLDLARSRPPAAAPDTRAGAPGAA